MVRTHSGILGVLISDNYDKHLGAVQVLLNLPHRSDLVPDLVNRSDLLKSLVDRPLRGAESVDIFKSRLKTFLFQQLS
jgi:hypothetical protein